MRVTFLTLDPSSASARIRITAHLPALRAAGIEAELVALADCALTELDTDVIVLHRVLLTGANLARLRGRSRLVFDLDDAVWRRPGGRASRRLERRLLATLAVCDVVVCGSRALQEAMAARGARVTRLLPPAPPLPSGRARPAANAGLVWTGSHSTLPYLEALGPVLAEVCGPACGLEVVADREPSLPASVPVRFTPWSEEAESEALERAGIGLYPLPDDPWARGKCAYKVRRYMSFGLPTVGVPWGAGAEVIDPPTAGLTASTPAEWWACLKRLLEDPSLRAAMGRRARARALAQEDPRERGRSWVNLLRNSGFAGPGSHAIVSPSLGRSDSPAR